MRGLHILQYNAGISAGSQKTLLANQKTQVYDIIALQEPSHNPQTGGTHCSRGSDFWPVYEGRGRLSRVALFFNKRLIKIFKMNEEHALGTIFYALCKQKDIE